MKLIQLVFTTFLILYGAKSQSVTFGGLFNIFDSKGDVDHEQLEHFAAFFLAINEINESPDILAGVTIDYVVRGGNGALAASLAVEELLENSIVGAINALPNVEASVTTKLLCDVSVMSVNSMATETMFGIGQEYPYKAQVIPIDSYLGMVYQKALCELSCDRVVVFATDDLYGTKFALELSDATFCDIEVLGKFTFPFWTTDFSDSIVSAQATGATFFVVSLSTQKQTALFLRQAYMKGLLSEGTLLCVTYDDVTLFFDEDDDVASILKGSISFSYYPDFSVKYTEKGKAFTDAWMNQASLGDCDTTADASGALYLTSSSGKCASLNLTAYQVGDKELPSYAALTYDATYTLALGLNYLMLESKSFDNGDDLRRVIFDNVSFNGATGLVNIFEGMAQFGDYGLGGREVGHTFKMMNFNRESYEVDPAEGFVPTGMWNVDVGISDCPVEELCSEVKYNSATGELPSAYPPYAYQSAPQVLKIGGLFGVFNADGTVATDQAEYLAAMIMAVNEINNKTDGVADDLLADSILVFAIDNEVTDSVLATASVNYLSSAFYGTGVLGVVVGLPSKTAIAADIITTEKSIMEVLSAARDATFGNGLVHTYKSQTVTIDTYSGAIIQSILCGNGVRKIAWFQSSSEFGIKSVTELSDESYCVFDVLSSHQFPAHTTDFSFYVKDAMNYGAQVFVLCMSAKEAAGLMEEGFKQGLFGGGIQLVLIDATNVASYFSADADVVSLMTGVLSIEYWPEYSLDNTEEGKAFLSRWISQQPLQHHADSSCPTTLDSNRVNKLYESSLTDLCGAVNFSAYDVSISGSKTLSPFVAHTYDATYLLAYVFDSLIKSSTALTSDNIRQAMYEVSFAGASGGVEIYEGMEQFGYYGRGNREHGVYYKVLNFNEDLYRAKAKSSDGMAVVGVWSVEDGATYCDDVIMSDICLSPVYASLSDVFPSDTRVDVIVVMSQGVRILLYTLSALIFVLTIVCVATVMYFRSTPEIRKSQESMLYVILFGEMMCAGRVLVGGLPLSMVTCNVGLWLGHMSFVFVFGALFLKSWRVNKLLNTKSLKRVVVKNKQIMIMMLAGVFAFCVLLIILSVVGRPHVSSTDSESENQMTKVLFCAFDYPQIHTTIFAIEGVLLFYEAYMCWVVKDIPDKYNESKINAAGKESVRCTWLLLS